MIHGCAAGISKQKAHSAAGETQLTNQQKIFWDTPTTNVIGGEVLMRCSFGMVANQGQDVIRSGKHTP